MTDGSGAGTAARRRRLAAAGSGSGSGRSPAATPAAPASARAPDPAPSATPTARRDLDPDVLAALEEERDFLLRSLEDLEREHEAGDVDDVDYLALRDDYTARAARVIRRLDERDRAIAAARPRSPRWRAWAVAAAVLVAGVVAGVAVAGSVGERGPGEGITGGIRETTIDLLAQASAQTAQANQALQAGDAEAAVRSYQAALASYDEVLELSPANAEALTYKGWLLHQLALTGGETETAAALDVQALELLDQAVAADPAYADARVFRAILHRNAGRPEQALADLEAVEPTAVPPYMRSMVDGLRAQVGGEPSDEPAGAPSG